MELRRILSLSLVLTAVAACRDGRSHEHSARAVGMLRAANEALRAYRAVCDSYPETLEPLRAPAPPAGASCERFGNLDGPVVDLVNAGLAPPGREPYALVYLPAKRTDRGPQRYVLQARWLGRAPGEHWSFWTSDANVLRIAKDRPATEDDRAIE
ncbi:MAG: hypothetical protein ABW221_20465 [Vicinamibacteria bacterium]